MNAGGSSWARWCFCCSAAELVPGDQRNAESGSAAPRSIEVPVAQWVPLRWLAVAPSLLCRARDGAISNEELKFMADLIAAPRFAACTLSLGVRCVGCGEQVCADAACNSSSL